MNIIVRLCFTSILLAFTGVMALKMVGGKFEDHPYINTILTCFTVICIIGMIVSGIWSIWI